MRFNNAAIPAGMAWTSPFAKWQGSLSEVSSIDLAGRLGAGTVSGPMISQACATSVACLAAAAGAVEAGSGLQLVVTTDRVSNGPQLLYPVPSAMGGAAITTHWVLPCACRQVPAHP